MGLGPASLARHPEIKKQHCGIRRSEINVNRLNNMSSFRKWIVAIRPFALSASSMPVIFGTAIAVVVGNVRFDIPLFLLSLLAMMTLHSGANMVNDVNDFRKGLDKVPTPLSGAIVRGLLTAEQVTTGAVFLLIVGSLIGLEIVWRAGLPVLYIGFAGLIVGVSYTVKPLALKYRGLGDLAVFLNFGVLGALGAWTVQTGRLSWLPVAWAVPMSMLVVAILHANNWRDISSDGRANVQTMASRLGDCGSLIYYGFLVFGSFAVIAAFVALAFMPTSFMISWLALPMAVALWRRARARSSPKHPLDFIALDGATAQLNLVFGLLCTAALILHGLLKRLA
jgi:1,4-dihydroxy-2-naphthoate octaprenyltransferase